MSDAKPAQAAASRVRPLPNDCSLVATTAGDVLVHCPPETLKVLLSIGLPAPAIILLPPDMPPGVQLGSSGFVRQGINCDEALAARRIVCEERAQVQALDLLKVLLECLPCAALLELRCIRGHTNRLLLLDQPAQSYGTYSSTNQGVLVEGEVGKDATLI